MIDITGYLGELKSFESMDLATQIKVARIIEFIQLNPASTLPYFKKLMGMSQKNKHIKTPEFWPKKDMIAANIREYKPSKFEVVEAGFRAIQIDLFAIYLATRTRFKPILAQ